MESSEKSNLIFKIKETLNKEAEKREQKISWSGRYDTPHFFIEPLKTMGQIKTTNAPLPWIGLTNEQYKNRRENNLYFLIIIDTMWNQRVVIPLQIVTMNVITKVGYGYSFGIKRENRRYRIHRTSVYLDNYIENFDLLFKPN
ncbi:MAG: hypothetical protein L6408_05515 [Nanoarchaeota archaeon]|nr:hypothetical protein [Nanoarchaeota archaeon]